MAPPLRFRLLILLVLANATPMLARRLAGRRLAAPLDGECQFIDGRRLFGPSKTIAGAVSAVLATAVGAPRIGLDWRTGARIGTLAMAGDLFSSFVKRRLGCAPSSPAPGLDQVPEALLPLLACRARLALTPSDIAAVVALFGLGEILLSRLLYTFDLRERPY